MFPSFAYLCFTPSVYEKTDLRNIPELKIKRGSLISSTRRGDINNIEIHLLACAAVVSLYYLSSRQNAELTTSRCRPPSIMQITRAWPRRIDACVMYHLGLGVTSAAALYETTTHTQTQRSGHHRLKIFQ